MHRQGLSVTVAHRGVVEQQIEVGEPQLCQRAHDGQGLVRRVVQHPPQIADLADDLKGDIVVEHGAAEERKKRDMPQRTLRRGGDEKQIRAGRDGVDGGDRLRGHGIVESDEVRPPQQRALPRQVGRRDGGGQVRGGKGAGDQLLVLVHHLHIDGGGGIGHHDRAAAVDPLLPAGAEKGGAERVGGHREHGAGGDPELHQVLGDVLDGAAVGDLGLGRRVDRGALPRVPVHAHASDIHMAGADQKGLELLVDDIAAPFQDALFIHCIQIS